MTRAALAGALLLWTVAAAAQQEGRQQAQPPAQAAAAAAGGLNEQAAGAAQPALQPGPAAAANAAVPPAAAAPAAPPPPVSDAPLWLAGIASVVALAAMLLAWIAGARAAADSVAARKDLAAVRKDLQALKRHVEQLTATPPARPSARENPQPLAEPTLPPLRQPAAAAAWPGDQMAQAAARGAQAMPQSRESTAPERPSAPPAAADDASDPDRFDPDKDVRGLAERFNTLAATPSPDALDRFANEEAAESTPEGLWRVPLAAGTAALLPGRDMVADWNRSYRGDFAADRRRNALGEWYDMEPGDTLRLVHPAIRDPGQPLRRGLLTGA